MANASSEVPACCLTFAWRALCDLVATNVVCSRTHIICQTFANTWLVLICAGDCFNRLGYNDFEFRHRGAGVFTVFPYTTAARRVYGHHTTM